MIKHTTELPGVYLIEPEVREDDRGSFTRTFCAREFADWGLVTAYVQRNSSRNRRRGTLRGLHYQGEPRPETRLVRCAKGSVYDVVVDLRSGAPTFLKHGAFELSSSSGWMLYVPAGFAHGFQTLEDDVEVDYLMSEYYDASLARGVRFDDPLLDIRWPVLEPTLSDRDLSLPAVVSVSDFRGWGYERAG